MPSDTDSVAPVETKLYTNHDDSRITIRVLEIECDLRRERLGPPPLPFYVLRTTLYVLF